MGEQMWLTLSSPSPVSLTGWKVPHTRQERTETTAFGENARFFLNMFLSTSNQYALELISMYTLTGLYYVNVSLFVHRNLEILFRFKFCINAYKYQHTIAMHVPIQCIHKLSVIGHTLTVVLLLHTCTYPDQVAFQNRLYYGLFAISFNTDTEQ